MISGVIGLLFATTFAQAAEYKLEHRKGHLLVKVRKAGLLSTVAHNHIIEAKNWKGSFTFDQADPGSCKLAVSVPVFDLFVDDNQTRARYGKDFSNKINDSQRAEIQSNMLAEGQLNVFKFATIDFTATSCTAVQGNRYDIAGDFSLRGMTKNITIKGVSIDTKDGALSMKGDFVIRATDFGFKPYSAAAGAIKNQDAMTIEFDVKGSEK